MANALEGVLDRLESGRAGPWFRVVGERALYRFRRVVRYEARGRGRLVVEALDERGGRRFFNVGDPYVRRGLRVPQRRLRPARPRC